MFPPQGQKAKLLTLGVGLVFLTTLAHAQEHPLVYVRHLEQLYYPPLAAAARIQGTVKLKLTISPDGKVEYSETLSNDVTPRAHPLLENTSIAFAKTWTFGCFNCAAGAGYTQVVTFTYRLEETAKSYPTSTVVMNLPEQVTLTSQPMLCDHCPSPAPALSFISPGSSIGLVQLGRTRNDVETVSPLKVTREFANSSADCKPRTEMTWSEPNGGGSISAFLRNGTVFQIESATRRYSTSEGITVNSSPSRLKRAKKHYGWLASYVLDPSGGKESDFHDLNYWVSRKDGIAFELAYSPAKHDRFVSKVIVFEPNTEFFPDGCIPPTQRWIEASPYSFYDN